jgi:hypothetical protein
VEQAANDHQTGMKVAEHRNSPEIKGVNGGEKTTSMNFQGGSPATSWPGMGRG